MSTSWISVHVSQDRETPVRTWQAFGFECRYAYGRSADTIAADELGQDYLTFAAQERAFVFVLCDGVSLSFYGDLAARYLGDALLRWAMESIVPELTQDDLGVLLVQCLQESVPEARSLVLGVNLPEALPPMLREVLEQKRLLGSETMFVCGRVDLPCQPLPAGRLVLAWMGDSVVRLWNKTGELSENLKGRFHSSQRWSTKGGPVGGAPNLFVSSLKTGESSDICSVAAYSDGLSVLSRMDRLPGDSDLQAVIAECDMDPLSDDISFLELRTEPNIAHP